MMRLDDCCLQHHVSAMAAEGTKSAFESLISDISLPMQQEHGLPPQQKHLSVVRHWNILQNHTGNLNKLLLTLLFGLTFFQCQVFGQLVLKDTIPDDLIVLMRECKLDEEQAGKIFTRLEMLAAFPGGFQKWVEYVNNNFDFDYINNNISDSVRVFQDSIVLKFLVTKDGSICAIRSTKGSSLLKDPSVRLLQLSPKWEPGINGGRLLNSYRSLRIDIYIDKDRGIKKIRPLMDSYFRENDFDNI